MASTISDILFQFRLFRFHLSRDPASFRRSERLFPDRNRLAVSPPPSSSTAYNLFETGVEKYTQSAGKAIVTRGLRKKKGVEGIESGSLDGAGCRFETSCASGRKTVKRFLVYEERSVRMNYAVSTLYLSGVTNFTIAGGVVNEQR